MALAHYIGYVENVSTGKALEGAVIRVYSYPGNILQSTFADPSSTPKPVVSSDVNGGFDFYIADGAYDIEYVVAGDVLTRLVNVPIYNPANNFAVSAQTIEFVATAGQTVFNFPAVAAVGFVSVFLNGVRLKATDFAHSGATVTLVTGATLGDTVTLEGFTQSAVPDLTSLPLLAQPTGSSLVGHIATGTGAVARTVQAKMRESVSVLDFGAVGNGTTDDTAAIQAAVTAHRAVNFGNHDLTFKVTGTITLRNGQKLDGRGATIQQFTDQTIIFNADNTDRVTIEGLRFVGKNEATFFNNSNSLAIAIRANGATRIKVTKNEFEGFHLTAFAALSGSPSRIEFSSNVVKGPGAAVLGVDINYRNCFGCILVGSYIRVFGNEVYDTAQGIFVGLGSQNVAITGNVVHDTINEHGMYIDAGVINCSITGNTVRNTGSIGIKFQFYDAFATVPRNLSITGNSVDTCGGAGIEINNTSGTTTAKGVTISGNTVNNTTGIGINVRYVSGGAVSGNAVHTSAVEAYYFDKCEDVVISGNHSKDATGNGLALYDNTRIGVFNNVFINPGKGGVDAGNTSTGIYCANGSYYTIQGNFLYGDSTKTRYGLFVAAGTQATHVVADNTMINCEEYGVRFGVDTPILSYRNNVFAGLTGPSAGDPRVATVASAATINLPLGHKIVEITGTTTITDIGSLGHNGNTVTLLFAGSCTVNRTSPVLISSNFAATASDTLTIMCDNGTWREISRSVN